MKAPPLVCCQHPGWVTDKDPPVEDTMIYFDIYSFWRIQISFWRLPIDGDECGEEVGEQHHSERVRRLYRAELPFQHLPGDSSALFDNIMFSPKERKFCAF